MESPERFRVEVLFSPGASHNPFEVVPMKQDHTLPIQPRMPLHPGTLQSHMHGALKPLEASYCAEVQPCAAVLSVLIGSARNDLLQRCGLSPALLALSGT